MKNFILLLICQVLFIGLPAQLSVKNLLCENLSNPVGIDAMTPVFSWQIASDKRNTVQSAYEIKVVSDKSQVWNSSKISSNQSVNISYGGTPLFAAKKYTW